MRTKTLWLRVAPLAALAAAAAVLSALRIHARQRQRERAQCAEYRTVTCGYRANVSVGQHRQSKGDYPESRQQRRGHHGRHTEVTALEDAARVPDDPGRRR